MCICFLPSVWAADEITHQKGESCASNADVCTTDFTQFTNSLRFPGYTKVSVSAIPGKANTYQLTIKGASPFLYYICCDKASNIQSQKTIDVNELLKQWRANNKSDLAVIVNPIRKKFKFIFLVSQATYKADKKELIMIVTPGKDSASVAANFSQPLNAQTSFRLVTKSFYNKYRY